MRLGLLILPEDPWPVAAAKWRRAEALGFDPARLALAPSGTSATQTPAGTGEPSQPGSPPTLQPDAGSAGAA